VRDSTRVCAYVVAGWLVAGVTAPASAGDSIPTFRGGVDLVALSVTVTDPKDKFVTGLDLSRFRVMEDGVPQDVTFFSSAEVPIDLTVLLDASASVRDRMPAIHAAATGFLGTLRPMDRGSVVAIKDHAEFLQALTGDRARLDEAVRQTTANGATALHDAIYLSLREFVRERALTGEVRRQAIVVLSDGADTSSLIEYDELMALVREAGVSIYTISLKPIGESLRAKESRRQFYSQADFTMKSLAQETGGRAFFPLEMRDLAGVYASIADELASQYSLGYVSTNTRHDGGYRRISVHVALPGSRTRTRLGYQAPGRSAMSTTGLAAPWLARR